MKLDKETLKTLKHIVDNALSQAEDDFKRADLELKRTDSIKALEMYEQYGSKYDYYMKAKEFVDSLEVTE